jgi:UDP-N-acetylglucosamine--N-acetylmuramyl-(pentapeptide) pyrophosphoryl-undecaprenol N-acetylglucosamine transferase
MKLLLLMCGEGLGHTSRCLALGKEFRAAGHEVNFGACGYSKKLVEKTGHQACEIPSEIKLVGETGIFDIRKSIKETLRNTSPSGFRRILELIEKLKTDVVLSDGYYKGILAAQVKKTPVYFIGHQFNMIEFFQKQDFLIRLVGKPVKRFYNYILTSVNGIMVPDYPLPYSVNRKNFTLPRNISDTIFFTVPLIRCRYNEVESKTFQRPNILSTIGAFGYRAAIFRNVIEAAKLGPGIHYTFISGPEIDPKQFSKIPRNAKFTGFTQNPFPYYKGADLVITAGRHGTILESLSIGLPVRSFQDEKHTEQENNATVVEEERYGKRMNYRKGPKVILACIREVLEGKQYFEKTALLRELAELLDGPSSVRKFLEEKIERRFYGKEKTGAEKLRNPREQTNRDTYILKKEG